MTLHEFDIIEKFFSQQSVRRSDVILGIGDDAAIVQAPQQDLILTIDTLVEGVHFLENTSAFDIGFKALAVNLSDLAAMGATPAWITLALTLPEVDENWLKDFSCGIFELAQRYNVQLIGGDLTRGPLAITIQAHGLIPHNQAIKRQGAKKDDLIYVTHTLGDAAMGLLYAQKKISINSIFEKVILTRLHRPEPRIPIGEKLRGIASAAIDISDGLVADLGHILKKSDVGAIIYVDHLPLSRALYESLSYDQRMELALSGGDDYELCFTVPPEKKKLLNFECTCIGMITDIKGLHLQSKNGRPYVLKTPGYQHF
ncbi:MAG: thiL [Gammaproteobacteria bacterium]|jgi:thiamine-monophosphate kinase|nr:thiL [Gammaproteobacteria bacterium]